MQLVIAQPLLLYGTPLWRLKAPERLTAALPGLAARIQRDVDIEVARTSNGYRFHRDEMLVNLTHELVHAKQFIAGELSPTTAKWKKGDYSKVPYSKQPWEREAYYWEKRLYEKFFEKLNA